MQSGTKTTSESFHPHNVFSEPPWDGATKRNASQTKNLSPASPRRFLFRSLLLALGIAPLPATFAETIVCGSGCSLQTINGSPSLAPTGAGTPVNYIDFRSASLNGNVVRLVNGAPDPAAIFGAVNMAGADTDPVTGNQVFIEGAAAGSRVFGGYIRYDPFNSSVKLLVKGNHVTTNGAGASLYGIYGGFVSGNQVKEARAEGNFVTIDEGAVRDISGGYAAVSQNASMAIVTGNTVTIDGGTVNGAIYGGRAEGNCGDCSGFAIGNTVTIKGGNLNGLNALYGGYGVSDGASPALALAMGNTVTITGNPVFGGSASLYGGDGSAGGAASKVFDDNRLNVWNYTGGASLAARSVQNFQYYDFVLPDTLAANGSLLTVYSADLTDSGGRHSTIERIALGGNRIVAPGETIVLIGASNAMRIDASTYDGVTVATEESAGGNGQVLKTAWALDLRAGGQRLTASLKSLETDGDLERPGGYGVTSSPFAGNAALIVGGALRVGGSGLTVDDSSGNGVIVDVGTLEAFAPNGTITLNLANTAAWNGRSGVRFRNVELGKAHSFALNVTGGGNYSVETYKIRGAARFTGHLNAAGSTLNFHVPAAAINNNGLALIDLTGTADVTGSTVNIAEWESATPPKKGDRITLIQSTAPLAGVPATPQSTWQDGLYTYTFDVLSANDTLTATLSGIDGGSLESYLVGNAFVTYQGGDFLADQGLLAARDAAVNKRSQAFAVAGGGKLRHKTGSHVDVKGHTFVAGTATGLSTHAGDATLAAFFEYGQGDYDAEHRFPAGKVKGKGDADYQGIGLLGRFDFDNATYLEGSLRAGRVETGYRANIAGKTSQDFRYDTRNGYLGTHIGGGKLWKLSESLTLDAYAKLLWTHQGKDSFRLSTGERIEFDAVNSTRVKLGARLGHAFTKNLTGFAGIACDHEFGGKAKAKDKETADVSFDTPKIEGGTGLIELGLTGRPSESQPVYVDFGVQGYAGKRQGVTANVRVTYLF
jgi:hypothetical protein